MTTVHDGMTHDGDGCFPYVVGMFAMYGMVEIMDQGLVVILVADGYWDEILSRSMKVMCKQVWSWTYSG